MQIAVIFAATDSLLCKQLTNILSSFSVLGTARFFFQVRNSQLRNQVLKFLIHKRSSAATH